MLKKIVATLLVIMAAIYMVPYASAVGVVKSNGFKFVFKPLTHYAYDHGAFIDSTSTPETVVVSGSVEITVITPNDFDDVTRVEFTLWATEPGQTRQQQPSHVERGKPYVYLGDGHFVNTERFAEGTVLDLYVTAYSQGGGSRTASVAFRKVPKVSDHLTVETFGEDSYVGTAHARVTSTSRTPTPVCLSIKGLTLLQ